MYNLTISPFWNLGKKKTLNDLIYVRGLLVPLKLGFHLSFKDVFSALLYVFKVHMLVSEINILTPKTQYTVEITSINGKWQRCCRMFSRKGNEIKLFSDYDPLKDYQFQIREKRTLGIVVLSTRAKCYLLSFYLH